MKRVVVGAVLSCLVATACGSTVAPGASGSEGAGPGIPQSSLGADGGSSGASASGGGTDPLGGTTGTAGSSGAGTTSGSSTLPGSTGSAGSSGVAAPGATPPKAGTKLAPIEVGILLFPDLNQFAGMFGGTADAGDQSLQVDTVVKWINDHGGAAGHKVVAVKHNVSLTSSDTYDQLAQQACEDFTVDHHTVAVFAPGTSVSDNFAACLQKKGVLYLSSGKWVHDSTDWKQYANMWSPAEANGTEVGRAMVDQVLGRHLAKKGESVGLMTMTEPGASRTSDNVIKPLLKAVGINVVEYTVPPPTSTADIGNSVAVVDSAELKMASQGVKTVMFLCPACLPFFAQNADSQKYYPRYIGSSFDSPAGITGATNDATMKSALMVGWEPHTDVGLYKHPNQHTGNPTRSLCTQIMAPSHQSTGDLSEYATQITCDNFLQVKYAADLNPANPLTGPPLQQGISLFGIRHPSAMAFTTNLAPGHHGGETSFRTMHWNLDTHAFVYDSPKLFSFR